MNPEASTRPGVITKVVDMGRYPYTRVPTGTDPHRLSTARANPHTGTRPHDSGASGTGKKSQ